MFKRFLIVLMFIVLPAFVPRAFAAKDFNIKNNSQSFLYVNGTSGNVGISSATPGQTLDVQGTVRAVGLTMSGQTPVSGYVLTASDSSGDATWSPSSSVGTNYWLNDAAGNVGISTTYAVGIGTTFVGGPSEAALSVMNGNVGIGTWAPGASLDISNGGAGDVQIGNGDVDVTNELAIGAAGDGIFFSGSNGYGIISNYTNGTPFVLSLGNDTNQNLLNLSLNNVGVGSTAPGQALDVQGTVRMKGFTLTGNGAANGNVLVGNSVGVGTWMPASTLLAGGGTNYWLINGGAGNVGINTSYAVGIGTSFVGGTGEAVLSIMNGNVGIGTWVPTANFQVANDSNSTTPTLQLGTKVLSSPSSNGTYLGINSPSGFTGNYLSFQNNGTASFSVGLGNSDPGTMGLGNIGFQSSGGCCAVSSIFSSAPLVFYSTQGNSLLLTGGSNFINTSGDDSMVQIAPSAVVGGGFFNPSSGNGTFGALEILPNINQTGTATGISRAVYINPTLTNSIDFRALEISIGNVGIGTISGNLGIGSQWPGQRLDVQGTARMSGFTLTGNGAGNGNVLVGNSVGVGTWMPASTLLAGGGTNYWLLNGGAGNVGINTSYAVGIGTSFVGGTGEAALSVMNGNVGIGTWVPKTLLQLKGSSQNFYVNNIGDVGIGSISPQDSLDVSGNIDASDFVNALGASIGGNDGLVFGGTTSVAQITSNLVVPYKIQFETGGGAYGLTFWNDNSLGIGTTSPTGALEVEGGNVGIGTWVPGLLLDVNGTARVKGFTLTGNGAGSGNVLVGNGVGVGTWMPASTLGTSGGSNYWLVNGGAGNVGINTSYAVGIGTTFVGGTGEAALSVMKGNVGIGTWVPVDPLYVVSTGGDIAVFQNNNASADGDIGFKDNTGTSKLWFGYGNSASGAPYAGISFLEFDSPNFAIYNNNGAVLNEYFTSSGNVGIGTFTVSDIFQVGSYSSSRSGFEVDTNGNVGIGTILTSAAAISVMNGNVGIGTWVPNGNGNGGLLDIGNAAQGDVEIDNAGDLAATGQINVDGEGVFADGAISSEGFFNASAPAIQGASGGGDADFLLDNGGSAGLPANSSGAGMEIDGAFTTAGTGTHPLIAGAAIFPMAITPGGASITNTAALYIDSAGTATVTGNKFALWVNSGNSDFGGNVGISSTAPGQRLDVQGTVRAIGLTMSGQTPISGYVVTAQDSNGDATWSPSSSVGTNYWVNDTAGNVGISTIYAVGIGTTFVGGTGEAAFSVMKGNVGIGTWIPLGALVVTSGNVGIGTDNSPDATLEVTQLTGTPPFQVSSTNTTSGDYLSIVNGGNVGIGSITPGQKLDIQGTLRALGEFVNGNVGIGTTFVNAANESALTVMNGNVGVGTWAGGGALVVMNGNVGIGTTNPTYQLAVANNAFIKTSTQNKSTFMAVSYGTGAGASDNLSVPAAAFTHVLFHNYTGYTLIDNGGNYNATNDYYVTPVAGIYMIITKFRITDSQTQFISYGQGAGTTPADSPTFLWCQTATTTATRNGSQNIQFAHFAAGSDIEMFVYTNVALDSSDGAFQIYLVTAD